MGWIPAAEIGLRFGLWLKHNECVDPGVSSVQAAAETPVLIEQKWELVQLNPKQQITKEIFRMNISLSWRTIMFREP